MLTLHSQVPVMETRSVMGYVLKISLSPQHGVYHPQAWVFH